MQAQDIIKWIFGVAVSAFVAGFAAYKEINAREVALRNYVNDKFVEATKYVESEIKKPQPIAVERRICDGGRAENASMCTSQCSAGKKAIGGGCIASGSHSYIRIAESAPTDTSDGWKCRATVDRADQQQRARVIGYAVCAPTTE